MAASSRFEWRAAQFTLSEKRPGLASRTPEMNRAFLILMAPAVLVAALYWGMGFRPSLRGVVGAVIFVALLVLVLRQRTKKTPKSDPQ